MASLQNTTAITTTTTTTITTKLKCTYYSDTLARTPPELFMYIEYRRLLKDALVCRRPQCLVNVAVKAPCKFL